MPRQKNFDFRFSISDLIRQSISAIIFTFTVFCSLAFSGSIPDTGQTKCYDDTKEIPCPAKGQDYYGQDAQYVTKPQSYTALNGGIIVQDNVTGLIWEIKHNMDGQSSYSDPNDADNSYTWQDAVALCDNMVYAGYSDWRLPTVKELMSIVNRDNYSPAVNPVYFPNTQSNNYYWWSSTVYADTSNNYAWSVYFNGGIVEANYKTSHEYVRCVRGGQ